MRKNKFKFDKMNRKKKTTRNVIIINKRTNERDLLKYSKKRMSRQLRYRWLSLAAIKMSLLCAHSSTLFKYLRTIE